MTFRLYNNTHLANVAVAIPGEVSFFLYSNVCSVTLRYDSVYLTCSKKLMGSQLSLPHGINKKLKCETKNKMISMIGHIVTMFVNFV